MWKLPTRRTKTQKNTKIKNTTTKKHMHKQKQNNHISQLCPNGNLPLLQICLMPASLFFDHQHITHYSNLSYIYSSIIQPPISGPKGDPLTYFLPSKLCTTYSYVAYNNRKMYINFVKQTFQTCVRKLSVSSFADFCQKTSVKL
jgi:hypothetical protein